MKKICSFTGHGNFDYTDKTKKQIYNILSELICDFGVKEFWVGNYGKFDKLASNTIMLLREQYQDIKLCLIIPYLTKEINSNKEYYNNYDNIIIAEIPEKTPKKYQILKCNQYMIDKSDYLIAFINHSFGGAAKTFEYARKKQHIKIFNLGELI